MNYARFVALRRGIWDEFETGLGEASRSLTSLGHDDLERLAFLYRQVLHDHALCAARFPGTGAASRLQALAVAGTTLLQRGRQRRRPSLTRFFAHTFPAAFRAQLGELGVAAALFAVTAAFGFVIGAVQPAAGTALLGPERITDLRDGRLWTESLTSAIPPAFSSSFIATNNMSVALLAWAGGALAGLGSVWVCLLNGFLLGAVVAVTLRYGMASALLEFVAAHGPLEITLILVSAGAGLAVARALVVAADGPRWPAVRAAAGSSLVVVLGCLPWFLLLGVVEGFISPVDVLPVGFKLGLGVALEALFLLVALAPWTLEADGGR